MKIAVLGTGMVGTTLAGKLADLGYEVGMGARSADNERAVAWTNDAGSGASNGTFADVVEGAEVVINCTDGTASLEVLASVGAERLRGKLLIDVANPLDFSAGTPPTFTVCNSDSLAEQIQRAHPECRVVKALNTVAAGLMAEPGRLAGEHNVFICGNDEQAKAAVRSLLVQLGWADARILDLGGIDAARALEMYVALWVELWDALGHAEFNVHVVTNKPS